jgi:Ca2+-transporting ATPase
MTGVATAAARGGEDSDIASLGAVAHGLAWEEVARRLDVSPDRGLDDGEAARRLRASGANEVEAARRPSLWSLTWAVVTEPFILMLAGAGLLAIALGEVRDGLLILGGVVPIVGADVATSYRAERALDALRAAAAPVARVRRDGSPVVIPAREVVPGDVLLLTSGDVIPADARVTSAFGALIDRSTLTGESVPEPCLPQPDSPEAPLADRRAVVHSGSSVIAGRAEAIVIATGRDTEVGQIAGSLAPSERRRSPLQQELDRLVSIAVWVATGLVVITVGLGLVRGLGAGQALLAGIAAAIAAIPEEPPVLLAVVLGLGAYRMLRRGVLVRRLNAQETLGAVDLILTDKTGTLTVNRLEVSDVVGLHGPMTPPERDVLLADALRAEANAWGAELTGGSGSFPEALSRAIHDPAAQPRLDADRMVRCEPPAEGHPYSLVEFREGVEQRVLAIGAPETILGVAARGRPPNDAELTAWERLVLDHADRGSRLLLVASLRDGAWSPQGLVGFRDPLRADVRDAITLARGAGIQVTMVTGDHPRTAASIAAEAGLGDGHVRTAAEIADLPLPAVVGELGGLTVLARATPSDKLRLVEAAHRAGRTLAVTGDGVNDAPALQASDVAVAMGSGTAVAREAADLVLGDDSFATLMEGLREGRRMVANVQKGLVFLISTHVALLGFVLLGTIAGFAQPLLPIQILWAELFIDISASVAFEREREEPGAMRRPPRDRRRPLLDRGILAGVALAGSVTALAALAILVLASGDDHARWFAFTVLAVGQAVRAYANRSLEVPIHRLPANGFLLLAVTVVVVVQLAIPYFEPLASAFRAVPLTLGEWGWVAAIALAPALAAELMRLRGWRWIA